MLYNICSWFLLFLMYSVLGYVAEIICCSIVSKKWVLNRGFLIGPYLPIYGFGCLIMVLFLYRYENDLFALFIMGAFYCTLLEYITSFLMEKLFKLRWWDYSAKKFNINGRVCLDNALLFGIGAIFVVRIAHPCFRYLVYLLPSGVLIGLAIILFIIFLADVVESSYITVRLKINVNNFVHKDATEKIKSEAVGAGLKQILYCLRSRKKYTIIRFLQNRPYRFCLLTSNF